MALEPWFYLAAVALFLADILAVLVLSGGLRFRRRAVAASVTILPRRAALFAGACPGARAGEAAAGETPAAPTDDLRKAALLHRSLTSSPGIPRSTARARKA